MAIIKKARQITPREAAGIAARFEDAARKADEQAQQLQTISGTLDSTWEGNAKNRFMSGFSGEPAQVRSYAESLRSAAERIRAIRVTIWEDVEVPDPPSPKPGNDKWGKIKLF